RSFGPPLEESRRQTRRAGVSSEFRTVPIGDLREKAWDLHVLMSGEDVHGYLPRLGPCSGCNAIADALVSAREEGREVERADKDRKFALIVGALCRANFGRVVVHAVDLVAVDGELISTVDETTGDQIFTLVRSAKPGNAVGASA